MAIRFYVNGKVTKPKAELKGAKLIESYRQPGTPFMARYVYDGSRFWYYTDDPREPLAVSCWPSDTVSITG